MKKIFVFLFAIFCIYNVVYSQQKSDKEAIAMLDRAAKKLSGAAYEMTLKMSVKEPEKKLQELKKMTVRIASNKLYLADNDMQLYFDGKTQWLYDVELEEVTVTEPTKEELLQISPMAIIGSYKQNYRVVFESSLSNASTEVVTLLPNNKRDEVFRIRFYLSKSDSEISRIETSSRSGQIMCFDISNYKKIPASSDMFRFNISKHPNVSVNDMR